MVDELKREWIQLMDPSTISEFETVSVMSYNVLANSLIQPQFYKHISLEYIKSPTRAEKIIEELLVYKADVICLQEVEVSYFENILEPRLKLNGYMGTFMKRTGLQKDGCSLFYSIEKFTEIEVYHLKYQSTGKDNVAIIAFLKSNKSNKTVCFATTHILFNPKRGWLKLAQIHHLCNVISDLITKEPYIGVPVVLVGDFNLVPYSHLYNYIVSGKCNALSVHERTMCGMLTSNEDAGKYSVDKYTFEYLNDIFNESHQFSSRFKLRHGLKLSSVYSHINPLDSTPEITTWHNSTQGTEGISVDYLFFGGTSKIISPIKYLSIPRKQLMNKMPNKYCPSDHLSLLAHFTFI